MPTAVSIKERIIRQAIRNLSGVTGIGTGYRWDVRGKWYNLSGTAAENLGHLDYIVTDEEDELVDYWSGSFARRRLRWQANLKFLHSEASTASTDNQRNFWQTAIYIGALGTQAKRQMTETVAPTQKLAYDTKLVGFGEQTAEDGTVDMSASFETWYYHNDTDPGVFGTVVTQLEE